MKYEEKIDELEKRVVALEKIERRRIIRSIILLSIYGFIVLVLIVSAYVIYLKLKPYKEKIDNLKNLGDSLKTDTIIDGSDGYGDFSDFFNGFFNY